MRSEQKLNLKRITRIDNNLDVDETLEQILKIYKRNMNGNNLMTFTRIDNSHDNRETFEKTLKTCIYKRNRNAYKIDENSKNYENWQQPQCWRNIQRNSKNWPYQKMKYERLKIREGLWELQEITTVLTMAKHFKCEPVVNVCKIIENFKIDVYKIDDDYNKFK